MYSIDNNQTLGKANPLRWGMPKLNAGPGNLVVFFSDCRLSRGSSPLKPSSSRMSTSIGSQLAKPTESSRTMAYAVRSLIKRFRYSFGFILIIFQTGLDKSSKNNHSFLYKQDVASVSVKKALTKLLTCFVTL